MRIPGFTAVLFLLASVVPAQAVIFPQEIKFKVRKGNMLAGSFNLSFGDDLNAEDGDRYQIMLSDFEGLGFSSGQQLVSFVFKDDLALFGHVVLGEDGKQVREVLLDTDCTSVIGHKKTRCFKYREFDKGTAGAPIQTEIFTPYKAIDLISSILVATHVADGERTAQRDRQGFDFIFNRSTKQVLLVYEGVEEIDTPSGRRSVVALSLRHMATEHELYKFYIGRDAELRRSFPVKVVFVDDKGSRLELVAAEVTW